MSRILELQEILECNDYTKSKYSLNFRYTRNIDNVIWDNLNNINTNGNFRRILFQDQNVELMYHYIYMLPRNFVFFLFHS